jgi:hypothetical protein
MSDDISLHGSKRARSMVLLLVAAAAVVLLLGTQESSARAEGACNSGQFCVFQGTFYTGIGGGTFCPSSSEPESLSIEFLSAKNRCGSEHIRIGWKEGGTINWKACMDPAGERPNPGRFNEYQRVGSC